MNAKGIKTISSEKKKGTMNQDKQKRYYESGHVFLSKSMVSAMHKRAGKSFLRYYIQFVCIELQN